MDPDPSDARTRRRSRGSATSDSAERRRPNCLQLRNPFTPQRVFSDYRVEAIRAAALKVLQELGIRVLLPEARLKFTKDGALIDEDADLVRTGSEIVASAPKSFRAHSGDRACEFVFEMGALTFLGSCGAPDVSDFARPTKRQRPHAPARFGAAESPSFNLLRRPPTDGVRWTRSSPDAARRGAPPIS
jgi:trimethylamine---corrinoid protein Co-methyltransferase